MDKQSHGKADPQEETALCHCYVCDGEIYTYCNVFACGNNLYCEHCFNELLNYFNSRIKKECRVYV
jgi:hypothetical protein